MSASISICSLAVVAGAVALTVYAFIHIFKDQQSSESDVQVIQRQIRGFALLMVANLVMVLGMMVCAGSLLPMVRDLLG